MRRHVWTLFFSLTVLLQAQAQQTFPIDGIADNRDRCYAFTKATIVRNARETIEKGTLLIRKGVITSVGTNVPIPPEATVIDCEGKYLYPSFIDLYTDYGLPAISRSSRGFDFNAPQQLTSSQKGAYGWNQAIRSDIEAGKLFSKDDARAKVLRDLGFGTVLTHQKDGIARGTGALVTLGAGSNGELIVREKASSHYSFNKGVSPQSYPGSIMGSITLLRQTFIDARWYQENPGADGVNLSLQAWNDHLKLPQIFDAGGDKWNVLRADRIGDEFGVQFIIKAGGNEYQRIKEIAATRASFILPLNYPKAMDVEDPNLARFVSLSDMKHWEMAPSNPASFEKAGIPFCLTTAELRDPKGFTANLRKAIEYGLSESRALESLTQTPATLLGVYDRVGSLEAGKLANFIITTGPLFREKTQILHNWVQGVPHAVQPDAWQNLQGQYNLVLSGGTAPGSYTLDVKSSQSANVIGRDTLSGKFSQDGKFISLSFPPTKQAKSQIRLSGVNNGDSWNGYGEDTAGNKLTWTATLTRRQADKTDSAIRKSAPAIGRITYPFLPFGFETLPAQETLLIRNATVWTSDEAGKLENTDVLVRNGKIVQVGKNLNDASARVIDGTGKHLTPGIIDEHSHIAVSSINEFGQSVTSEVRIADNLDPDDINIYRQLSGGVTTSHILHGSANTIGGQTQLIKLRWGLNDQELKFAGAPGFIKFALGENVKRSSMSLGNNRFPDTRMGVEQVMVDAFTRARDYQAAIGKASAAQKGKKDGVDPFRTVRRDLELEALVEILEKKRFITCHSYVQSEINAAIKVGEKMGFTFNTFTHILEGYKVADKMKAHGAQASTFSDWWAYKMEVYEAIPYNPAIMHRAGLNVAINSDDAEMARRLNQEAAKSIKYGGLSEIEALNMVTINPAKMLFVADKTGSIKVGKDADLVLWSDNPLSIYAKAEKTIVDGIVYFDRERDAQMRKTLSAERNRLIQKLIAEKKKGGFMAPALPTPNFLHFCEDGHHHRHGLLTVEVE